MPELEKLTWQVEDLKANQARLERDIESLKAQLSSMADVANRWKGGFIVILALGGLIGWLLSVGSGVRGFFR